jgi:hypothetical protein
LIFDDPEMTEVRAPEVVEDVAVPRDVLLSLEIRSDLRLAEAAVGDVVEAVLRGDLKQGKVKVVPKGSTVKGRIVQLDRWDRYVELVIRFTDIEWPGHHAEVRAKFERRAMVQPRYANVQGAEGAIVLTAPVPKTLKGEMLLYRTER